MKKKILLACLMVLAVASLSFGAYYAWLTTPPAMPENADEVVAVMSSDRYKRLSEAERRRYAERAREILEGMDDDAKKEFGQLIRDRAKEDDAFRDSVREAQVDMFLAKAREFAMADEFNRQRLLDQVITAMELARMARSDKPRSDDTGAGDGGGDGDRKAQRAERRQEATTYIHRKLEEGNPQTQAYVGEFFKALAERREELGLPDHEPRRRR